jgi:hypothetical protein
MSEVLSHQPVVGEGLVPSFSLPKTRLLRRREPTRDSPTTGFTSRIDLLRNEKEGHKTLPYKNWEVVECRS